MLLTGDSRGTSSLQPARDAPPALGIAPPFTERVTDERGTVADERGPVAGSDLALRELAWSWAHAVRGTSYVDLTAEQLHDLLTELAGRLADALRASTFDTEAGFAVGMALVGARLASTEALQRSIAALSGLPAILDLKPDVVDDRTGPLLGAVAAGFMKAAQDRILQDQEHIRDAALGALADAEVALRDSEARLRAVFGSTGIAVAIGDLEGTMLEVNAALADMLGHDAEDLVGRRMFDFFDPDDVPQIQQAVYGQLVNGERAHVRLEKRFLRGDGEHGWTMLAISIVRAGDGTPAYLVAMGEDVTERHRLQRELHHQAHHDPLTGLPNRLLLYQHLEDTLRDAGPDDRLGMCFIDLDEFKTVNDTLGHGSGDRLLIALSERLRAVVTRAGHFVARVGGDEFVVVVDDTRGPSDVTGLAEEMLAELSRPIRLDGHELSVSASIGIVEQPAQGSDLEEMLRAADATLYLAKADGRARYAVFDAGRNAQQLMLYGLTARMPGAIERGELAMLYQPLVSLVDRRLRGAEALLRWNHPELGVLSPNTFIPVAEQSGMIATVGRWVLYESCAQAARWQQQHPERTPLVSVNVSGRQATDPGLLDDVLGALRASGLSPANLQLELTETVLMQSYDQPDDRGVQTLRALADQGIRIVIDDFGIGYSNLAYLRHLPVHGLKLAGAFMAGIRNPHSDHVDAQIVETVIRLAHTLGMTVTAEGIETAEQADRLAALGCDLAQGWHFGRPGPGPAIADLVPFDFHDGITFPA
jgi:diguanylate cyclase (GGDEF)-like protein/PAS domain S-box-containing protein